MLGNARTLGGVAVLGLVALSLSGCTPADQLYARSTASGVEFLVCEAVNGEEISVQGGKEGTIDYTTLWVSQGSSTIEPGFVVTYGQNPDDWTSTVGPTEDSLEGLAILVSIGERIGGDERTPGKVGRGVSAGFVVDDLVTDKWTDNNGTVVDRPCG